MVPLGFRANSFLAGQRVAFYVNLDLGVHFVEQLSEVMQVERAYPRHERLHNALGAEVVALIPAWSVSCPESG